jgi:hypothetical protein
LEKSIAWKLPLASEIEFGDLADSIVGMVV